MSETPTSLLTAAQAAAFLAVELSTIRKWTHQRRLPVVKVMGRLVRYRLQDLEKLVTKWARPALRAVGEDGRP